jgi:UDP-galactopyranose mutase
MRHYDYIIVGSGIYGIVLAERLRSAGKSVLIIERRNHIGGNCYSYEYEDTNITIHKYGTHIFHCSNKSTWDYVNIFGEFNRHHHRVLTLHGNKTYSMPINLDTINNFYGINLKPSEVESFVSSKRVNIEKPKNLEEKAVSLIGFDLYNAFIKGYTKKQWGCDPRELPPEIITRLPVRNNFYDSYYNDYYQGLPCAGYTAMFKSMLKGIDVELNVDFFDNKDSFLKNCDTLIYTGHIDRFFDYSLGRLKWRSVRFEIERLEIDDFQGISVMNYADEDVAFTRIHEPKHLHREKKHKDDSTVVIREYSFHDNDDPYYPVNSDSDKQLLAKYKLLAEKESKVIFGGRLAEYKYYDMHHTIEAALVKFEDIL